MELYQQFPRENSFAMVVDDFGSLNEHGSHLGMAYEALALKLVKENVDVTVLYLGESKRPYEPNGVNLI